tara:strand:+ start:648 stop:884 length:237 start_codon:yes stop_codon:yes gene_type:complete
VQLNNYFSAKLNEMKSKEHKRAEQLSKIQLRFIVDNIRTIDSKKLFKMSKEKLIPIVATLSLIQIRDILQGNKPEQWI